ncbi:hypothetical protein AYL99_11766 [Fonsecaea erecta]|uniref:Uncharacterized protein n=1 Tax=Fonsecaea erecta TaxID=1367422 RepID=A0A178Z3I4_9EURO|nr:hypothetical protein AYL99_11766 [Fonsecaea erecta]OAP54006.1 hypothetical protein AYL99_11766 [Fonsecaea erecta]
MTLPSPEVHLNITDPFIPKFASPLSSAGEDQATGLTREEYKIKSIDGTELSLPALIYLHDYGIRGSPIDVGTEDLNELNRIPIARLGPEPLHDVGCVFLWVEYRMEQKSAFWAQWLTSSQHCHAGTDRGWQFAWSATHIAIDLGLQSPCGIMALHAMFDPKMYRETKGGFEPQLLCPPHKPFLSVFDPRTTRVGFEPQSFPRFDEQREQVVRRGLREGWDVFLRRVDFTWFPAIVRKYTGHLRLSREDLARLPPILLDVNSGALFGDTIHNAREVLAKAGVVVFGGEYVPSAPGTMWIWTKNNKEQRRTEGKMWEGRRQFLENIWKN